MSQISTGYTLGGLIKRNARFMADAVAYTDGARQITHAQYHDRARRLATALEQFGCAPQDRVGMLSMNSIEYFEFYGACELAGFMALTFNYRLALPEIERIAVGADPSAILFEEAYTPVVEVLRTRLPDVKAWICIGDGPSWSSSYEAVLAEAEGRGTTLCAREDDIAHLIFTSGTTGLPKGCMLSHRASVNKALIHACDMGLSPADRVLLVMPYLHVGAKGIQTGALWRGSTVLVQRSFDPARVLDAVERERATVLHLAPTMVQAVLEQPDIERRDLSSVRVVCYSAAPMPLGVLARGLELMGDVFHQVYGQTEGAISTLLRCQHRLHGSERERRRLVSVGQPLMGVEVKLLSDDGNEVPCGDSGEIVYRGAVMFSGYWNDMPATVKTLRNGWVHSGDVGRFDEDGFLYIVDRKKDMIISGGENIYSREVEQVLEQHPAVREAAVIGVADDRWGEAVRAVVACRPHATVDEAGLVSHCRQQMAGYKRPRSFIFVDELPKLHSGKIDKVSIRALYGLPTARDLSSPSKDSA